MPKAGFWTAIASCLFLCGGCATSKNNQEIQGLQRELSVLEGRSEALTKENLSLKRELTLFQKAEGFDGRIFLGAQEDLEQAFAAEITDGDLQISISDRGLGITVCAERLFNSGSDTLSEEGKRFLDALGDFLKQRFAGHYIYVEGHTDNQSLAVFEWKSDLDLSFARAVSIVDFFTQKGMNPSRFSASGFGQNRPRASNETKEGRRLNRRMEIIVSPQKIESAVLEVSEGNVHE